MEKQQGQVEHKLREMGIHDRAEQEQGEQGEEQQQQGEQGEGGGGKWQRIQVPEKQLPLFMVDFEHCDAKKCTGKKMERFKLLTKIKDKKKKFKGVVLSAYGSKFISTADSQYIDKYGICVIDCSWNRIEETREFRYKHERKLPFVVAGNPVNFGKPYQLSCVEALVTGLCAVGYAPQAKYIMSKFGWSDGFWQQNPEIEAYGGCGSQEEMEKQSKVLEARKQTGFVRNYDLPSEESDEGEEVEPVRRVEVEAVKVEKVEEEEE